MDSGVQLSKRTLLRQSTALPLVWAFTSGMSAHVLAKSEPRRVIADLLDVLIPKDMSPSATQLKVDQRIWEHGKLVTNYENMLLQGAAWLDQQALRASVNAGFMGMNLAQKNQVVAAALSQPPLTLPRVFMERLIADAFRFYYGHPEAYRHVRGLQPIQPLGYPNHYRAP